MIVVRLLAYVSVTILVPLLIVVILLLLVK